MRDIGSVDFLPVRRPVVADDGDIITLTEAMVALSKLREPLDRFFTDVTVNADDAALRLNRLRLLASLRAVMQRVADFSALEG